MYHVEYTNRFKKDLKRCAKRGLDLSKVLKAVKLLEANGELPIAISHINCMGIKMGCGNVIYNRIG